MAVGATTVGPVKAEVRDELRDFRDKNGYPHYNAAIEALLAENGD